MFWHKVRNEPGGENSAFGRYQVLSTLGAGAMATVYLAEDPVLNRKVAVKAIHPNLSSINMWARFRTEAKTAASLRSPHIVEVFDYGVENERQYLVLEYMDGPSLQSLLDLKKGLPLDGRDCAAIVCQAAEGLAMAQKQEVVHRDIKPANLLFNSEGILKIADFGLAHINEQSLTLTGSVLGSPSYMSPEQVNGGQPTPGTDLFSLGVILYRLLTGRLPFSNQNVMNLMRDICDAPHPPILQLAPEADAELADLAGVLLNKDPAERGEGAGGLALQLRAFLNRKNVLDPVGRCRGFVNRT